MLEQAYVDAVKVCIRSFNHRACGSPQKLVQGCLYTVKVCKRCYNHCGSLQKLVQAWLGTSVYTVSTKVSRGNFGHGVFPVT